MTRTKAGFLFGIGAYTSWGLLPFYWKVIDRAGAFEILAHRGVWALLLCVVLLVIRKQITQALLLIKKPRTFAILLASALCLSANWAIYIWSVTVNRVVEAALGYYINPLIAVCFGVLMLNEKLRPLQWLSVAVAGVGVVILTIGYGSLPWIALLLALTWGAYGLLKKALNAGALETLSVETLIVLAPNFGYLLFLESQSKAQFGHDLLTSLLLLGGGFVTVVPLLMWNGAVIRLPLSVLGLLQYVTPTIMFMIGIFVNHENMTATKLYGFIFIWCALIFLGTDALRSTRSTTLVEDL